MVELHKYDPKYAVHFRTESARISNLLNNICKIEHIGSTAVPGLDGKGVIDMMLVFDNETDLYNSVQPLKDFGYFSSANDATRNGRVFMSTVTGKESGEGDVHLHLVTKDNIDYKQVVLFRDYLIKHPDVKQAYIDLKHEIVEQVNGDRKEYTKSKDEFINNIIKLAIDESDSLIK